MVANERAKNFEKTDAEADRRKYYDEFLKQYAKCSLFESTKKGEYKRNNEIKGLKI